MSFISNPPPDVDLSGLTGEVNQNEALLDALDTLLGTKASQAAVNTLDSKANTLDGKVDTLDGKVNAITSSVGTLVSRLTSGRASNLDNLNATVSSRATQTSLNTVDSLADTLVARLTSGRASNLDNLNASISSRASQTSVNALPTTPIKSVQRGTLNLATFSAVNDVTIASVNTAKSLAFITWRMNDFNPMPAREVPTVKLINSTTLRVEIEVAAGTASDFFAEWQVIEYV